MDKIEQLRLNGQLPSPKGVALAIMEICRREDATLDAVARVVQTDPALSARLLRLANSAAHAGRAVASINEAVMRLGMATVRQLAMGFSLVDQYPKGPCQGFDYAGFWSHSLLMAVASQELGSVMRVGAPDELFTCGLLGQIGRLALATVYPADYAVVLKQSTSGAALLELEHVHLEVDHNAFTAAILADCGIPKALAEPLLSHEAPDKSGFAEESRPHQLAQLFFQARRIADLGLTGETERHGKISELMRLGGKIGLDAGAFGELFDRIMAQWQAWGELLKVPVAALPAFDNMAHAPVPRPKQEIQSSGMRVLLVDDEPTSRIMTERVLHQLLGHTVYTAENGQDALALALEVIPQIVITDWLMPVMDGLELCRALRATDWGQSMYVIMLTGVETEEMIVEAFEAGVDDYVTKPVNIRALNARMRAALHYVKLLESWEHDRAQLKQFAGELAISNRRLEYAAMTDPLTGLSNRRAGMEALAKSWSASQRTNQPLAALAIDIDHFKSINDRHGHAVGDLVLQEVAKAIQSAARKHDSVSRMGGEEFLLICHDADPRAAVVAAERLRRMVRSLKLNIEGAEIQTSVSVGVASREEGMEDADDMVRSADKALYAAKHAGRNRVCQYTQGKTIPLGFGDVGR
ncbi:MAG: diguanylate cyclase [Rhodocyclaceae bacterium]|nr:diguanylate cyclase [Rhodocyclaceae bacterium]